ncbi:hypothetical protein AB1Y20_014063 [Prymnesium parvum]|uniref:Uncharacterized protein n=1 Tax=Prymnesium parvum TaxID=97485 RepID=A0AB34IEQ6_PRYPA
MEYCQGRQSGPIQLIGQHNAHIELLTIRGASRTPSGPAALYCEGSRDVTIRRVRIEHPQHAVGLLFVRCPRLLVEQLEVIAIGTDRPNSGCASGSHDCENVHGQHSAGVTLTQLALTGGSSGVELHDCPYATLRTLAVRNVRGPYPRGQAVQFSLSPHSVLEDFYAINTPFDSWVEDIVSVWRSANCSVRRGLIDGNNSPTGVGVMFENAGGEAGGYLADVDAVNMGDGCFSGYPADGLTIHRCRCGWNHCKGWGGREDPKSGGQLWAAGDENGVRSRGVVVRECTYWDVCAPWRPAHWQQSERGFASVDITQRQFTPRAALQLSFCSAPPPPERASPATAVEQGVDVEHAEKPPPEPAPLTAAVEQVAGVEHANMPGGVKVCLFALLEPSTSDPVH